jgi:tetratricopeptide (TPR) repeat protein
LWLKREPLTGKRLLQIVPYVVMGVGMGLFVMWWESHHQGTGTVNLGLNIAAKILIAGRAFWFYLWKLFWPVDLTFSYPRWNINPASIWQYVWPTASASVVFCVWLLHKRVGRAAGTAILFFVAMLFPMLGFFSLYTFIYTFAADHYQYAACIGPIALVAAGGARALDRSGRNTKVLVLSAAGILLITLGVLTWRQCRIYMDRETLWQDTLNKNPDSLLAHGQIMKLLFEQGKFIEAKPHLERSIELASYMKTMESRIYASIYYNYGIVLEKEDRLDEAASNYQKALDSTDYFEVLMNAHYRLARVLVYQGKDEQARIHYLRALELAKANKNDFLAEKSFQEMRLLGEKKKAF